MTSTEVEDSSPSGTVVVIDDSGSNTTTTRTNNNNNNNARGRRNSSRSNNSNNSSSPPTNSGSNKQKTGGNTISSRLSSIIRVLHDDDTLRRESVSFRSLSEPANSWMRTMYFVVRSTEFEGVVALLITINCFVLGFEAQFALDRKGSTELEVLEHIFVALFLLELIVRVFVLGYLAFMPFEGVGGHWWNFVDAVVVIITGILPTWILPLFTVDKSSDTLRVLTVLRLIRVARVVRSDYLHEIWVLLRGMFDSMRMLFWTAIVISFLTYIFAVVGVVMISPVVQKSYEHALKHNTAEVPDLAALWESFGGITQLMYTLTQVLTLDGWSVTAANLMDYAPGSWVFFYAYIGLVVIVLMNLVTAVLVDRALINSQRDAEEVLAKKERTKSAALRRIRKVFEAMDEDASGYLSREEFYNSFQDEVISKELRAMEIEQENCEEIFNLLDNGDGNLSLDEFFDGITRMEGMATAKDLFRLLHKTDKISKTVQEAPISSEGGRLFRSSSGAAMSSPDEEAAIVPGDLTTTLANIMMAVQKCTAKVDTCMDEVLELRKSWEI